MGQDPGGPEGHRQRSGKTLVGYWISREKWGKGVASRALSLFLLQVRTRPLFAHVAKNNLASIRVLQKCGFLMSALIFLTAET
jgi:RimJ/RimL family protein N-acetyltransferase